MDKKVPVRGEKEAAEIISTIEKTLNEAEYTVIKKENSYTSIHSYPLQEKHIFRGRIPYGSFSWTSIELMNAYFKNDIQFVLPDEKGEVHDLKKYCHHVHFKRCLSIDGKSLKVKTNDKESIKVRVIQGMGWYVEIEGLEVCDKS